MAQVCTLSRHRRRRLQIAVAAMISAAGLVPVSAVNWIGTGGNDLWSNGGNWSNATPYGNPGPRVFDNVDAAGAAGTTTSISDGFVGNAITEFRNTTGNFHTVERLSDGLGWNTFDLIVNQNIVGTTNVTFKKGAGAGVAGLAMSNNNNVLIGRRTVVGGTNMQGIVNASTLDQISFTASNILLGTTTTGAGSETAQGQLLLAVNNLISATQITVGDSGFAGQTSAALQSHLQLGQGTNTVTAGTFLVGGRKSFGLVDIRAGGDLILAGGGDLIVGRNNGTTATSSLGTFNLSGGDTFNATLDQFHIGAKGDTLQGSARGLVTLANNSNNITANEIIIGQSGNDGFTAANQQSQLHLGGGTNVINTPVLIVGDRKTTGLIDFATAGGSLNLGTSGNRVAITLGRKSVDTGANPAGTMDLSLGSSTIFASNINLGQETNLSSAGVPVGNLILGSGSLDVSGNISENHIAGGAGTSNLTVQGAQTFTIGGAILVDTFTIGLNGSAASVTYTNPAVTIGSTAVLTDLFVGRRTADVTSPLTWDATLDLSASTTFTGRFDQFEIGTVTGGGGGQGRPQGLVLLAQNNNIEANSMLLADSAGVGLGGFNNRLVLGDSNIIKTDALTIGGSKGVATIEFDAPGGTLDLTNKSGGRIANVFVGRQIIGTGGGAGGTLDLLGGGGTQLLGNLVIGSKINAATGTTTGTVSMDGGTMDATAIILGQRNDAGSAGVVRGTFNLAGGTLIAGTITPGSGNGNNAGDQANFNHTGGVLVVNNFNLDYDPTGGTLAPGGIGAIGTTDIDGFFDQGSAAILHIDIASAVLNDFVTVTGTADLDGILQVMSIGGFATDNNQFWDLLTATDITLGSNFSLNLSGLTVNGSTPYLQIIQGGNGEILRLSTIIPEPATCSLALLTMGSMMLRRRRNA